MEPLDKAKLEKCINTILQGKWAGILSSDTFLDLTDWFHTHKDKKVVSIRFTFFEEVEDGAWIKHALHLACSPIIKDKRVVIKNIYLANDDQLLALPADLYEKPLFCIPDSTDELLENID